MSSTLSQNVTLPDAFEPAQQINKELKRPEFDSAFCRKFKFAISRYSSFVSLNVENR